MLSPLGRIVLLMAFLAGAGGLVTTASANATYTASLGAHGGTRWTPRQSVYVNLKAMTPGVWKEELWAGTCAAPAARIAVLPGLVVLSTRMLA